MTPADVRNRLIDGDPQRPSLVVTLLNIHRPRDRSHYECFAGYHQSFYHRVEATSVTPSRPLVVPTVDGGEAAFFGAWG